MHGLGPKRTQRIADAWEEQKAIKEVMVFLSGVGVSTSLAVRIYKTYADDSIAVVRSEPYRLASEVWGIGFKTADTIAQAVGIPHDSPERIKAGLQYTLSQAADNGHCYLPEPDLIREADEDPGGRPGADRPVPGRARRPRRVSSANRCRPATIAPAARFRRSIWCRFTAPSAPWRAGSRIC